MNRSQSEMTMNRPARERVIESDDDEDDDEDDLYLIEQEERGRVRTPMAQLQAPSFTQEREEEIVVVAPIDEKSTIGHTFWGEKVILSDVREHPMESLVFHSLNYVDTQLAFAAQASSDYKIVTVPQNPAAANQTASLKSGEHRVVESLIHNDSAGVLHPRKEADLNRATMYQCDKANSTLYALMAPRPPNMVMSKLQGLFYGVYPRSLESMLDSIDALAPMPGYQSLRYILPEGAVAATPPTPPSPWELQTYLPNMFGQQVPILNHIAPRPNSDPTLLRQQALARILHKSRATFATYIGSSFPLLIQLKHCSLETLKTNQCTLHGFFQEAVALDKSITFSDFVAVFGLRNPLVRTTTKASNEEEARPTIENSDIADLSYKARLHYLFPTRFPVCLAVSMFGVTWEEHVRCNPTYGFKSYASIRPKSSVPPTKWPKFFSLLDLEALRFPGFEQEVAISHRLDPTGVNVFTKETFIVMCLRGRWDPRHFSTSPGTATYFDSHIATHILLLTENDLSVRLGWVLKDTSYVVKKK